jgi:dTDP-4-dehydrorhamnose reductase
LGSNQEGWDEIIYMEPVTGFYPEPLFTDARRFDAGGKANPVTIPMVRAGLQTVFEWGPSAVQEYCAPLTDSLADQLSNLFGDDIVIRHKSQRSAHILGVRFSPHSSYYSALSLIALNAELKKENVYASVRGEWLRLAVYLHNSVADVNRFVSLFVQITQKLCLRHSLIASPVISSEAAPKRILITGSAGWLSQFVLHTLLRRTIPTASYCGTLEIFAAYSSIVPHWVPASHCVHLDLSDTEEIQSVIERIRPDIIIHTAALSSPVVCHKDERRAYSINCPNVLIQAVKGVNPDCLFIFTSTDMVYDGESPPYLAAANKCDGSAPPSRPVNVYGATKLSFEKEVQTLKHGVVLRLSNMIGESSSVLIAFTVCVSLYLYLYLYLLSRCPSI